MITKKIISYYFLLVMSFTAYSQITFEPGYYITNEGQKVNGLVRNADWSNNPTSFEFKTNTSAKSQTINMGSAREFGIDDSSKYVRARVDIDRSTEDIATMSTSRAPDFNEETLFLEVLVEGNATLYKYKDGQLIRYFFKTENSDINQLIYKKYLFSTRTTAENKAFQQQLYDQVNCLDQSVTQISNLSYTSRQLVAYFVTENACSNEAFINYEANRMKADFNLHLRAGVNFSSLSVSNVIAVYRDSDFGNSIDPRFGIEAEVILPFNKGKWSLFTEPYYESYSGESFREGNSGPLSNYENRVDYESIGLPFGIRYYAFLNEKLAAYLNLGVQWHFDFDNEIVFARSSGSEIPITIKAGQTLFFGAGLSLNKRYSLEFRYNTSRDLTSTSGTVASEFQVVSLSLGYKLF
ncbi:MAG: tRNA modification GTPase [Leeuwenhoekiella sp.]|nr:MAG: tRNA modification GTPase [Leeuwenhoekiella sp.]